MASIRERRILALLNAAEDAGSLADDVPGAPKGRGLPPGLAIWLLRVRDGIYGGEFKDIRQVDAIYGVGEDTLADLYQAARSALKRRRPPGGRAGGSPTVSAPALGLEPESEARVLRFLNVATAAEIAAEVQDDPKHGRGPPGAYGVRRGLAAWIVTVRDKLHRGSFKSLSEVAAIWGLGEDTLHDIIASQLAAAVEIPQALVSRVREAPAVVVITGAGVSAPAPTSLPSAVAGVKLEARWTAGGFADDIQAAWDHHLKRRDDAEAASANQAHTLIHELARYVLSGEGRSFSLITQNQDCFHHKAQGKDSYDLFEVHGNLFEGRCLRCEVIFTLPKSLAYDSNNEHTLPANHQGDRYFVCAACGGIARPTAHWIGDPYTHETLAEAGDAVKKADLVLFLGTSGDVPAIRWLLHEAHWHARAYTAVFDAAADDWVERDDTPTWPGAPIIDAPIEGDIIAALESLKLMVGWGS